MSEIRMITTHEDVDALPADAKLEDPKTGLAWSSWRVFTPPSQAHRETLISKLPMIYKNHPDDQKSLYSVTEINERLAVAWAEGHETDEHGVGNCECDNPYEMTRVHREG